MKAIESCSAIIWSMLAHSGRSRTVSPPLFAILTRSSSADGYIFFTSGSSHVLARWVVAPNRVARLAFAGLWHQVINLNAAFALAAFAGIDATIPPTNG